MSSTPPKSKKARTKPPKTRLAATSAISQPAIADTPALVTVSSFTLNGDAQSESINGAPTKRYTESSSVGIRSGIELGQDSSMDDIQTHDADGELDAEMAEMSLGQRLTALTGAPEEAALGASSSDEEDAADSTQKRTSKQQTEAALPTVPASSLTRTLIQALHSSDAGLLETCLAHSNAALIQNTVRRLPPQLAVPLVTACVERLGRGKRVGRGKGGGAGAGAQRGTGLVRWIRTVLIIHGGHLLTMPDLVARLSGLHATLTTRLTLQESLLSLSGRLDMAISQIEMRSSAAPAPLPLPKGKNKGKGKRKRVRQKEVRRYVEGESEEEEGGAAEGMDVEVESGSEAGSVEDVELGGSDDDDDIGGSGGEEGQEDSSEEDEEDEDEEEDEDSEDGGGVKINGFIDDEAEEFTGDEDEEESD